MSDDYKNRALTAEALMKANAAEAIRQRARADALAAENARLNKIAMDAVAKNEQQAARLAAAEAAIRDHNTGCIEACQAQGKRCEPYTDRDLQCPDCPRDWMIEWPRATDNGTECVNCNGTGHEYDSDGACHKCDGLGRD